MGTSNVLGIHSGRFRKNARLFFSENRKIILQSIITLFFLAISIWFLKHEHAELGQVKSTLLIARWPWVLAGIALTGIYFVLQGQMYVFSFRATNHKISLPSAILLFIRRNFISVFLPAGGLSSLAFYTQAIEKQGIKKTQIYFASSIYGFNAILSVIIVAVPALLYSAFNKATGIRVWLALSVSVILCGILYYFYRSLMRQGFVYRLILRISPQAEVYLNDLQYNKLHRGYFLLSLLISVSIEFCGIFHLYVAMIALGVEPSFYVAVMGYIISVIFLIISPFLRGLGAIEVSLTFILIRYGLSHTAAISVTFLYRFFEFWLPLFVGLLVFLSKANRLLMRVLPAAFLFVLGFVNIISVITPSIGDRVALLKDFLPVTVIHASNLLVIVAGFLLLVTAAFMLKGLKTSWWLALLLSLISLVGHITKAIDFEEASLALVVVLILIMTKKEYYVKTNPKLRNVGIQTSLLLTAAIFIYGIIGFYLLDHNHFNTEFNLADAIRYTFQNYFLIGNDALNPASTFARYFIYSLKISGLLSISFLIYTLVNSYTHQPNITEEELEEAESLLQMHGKGALDYFKTYPDKLIFFSQNRKAFLAYRITGNYAVVLEDPVSPDEENSLSCINEFEKYAFTNGLKSLYYRVPGSSLPLYHSLKKKDLFIGQEAIVDVTEFSLSGGSRRSIRNALNKVRESGYTANILEPPIKDGELQKIKLVSDEWLHYSGRKEIVFSQGMFVWEELKEQVLITIQNSEEKIIAFLNVISDYAPNEITYDLIRKTKDAPNGVMDFLLVELFRYAGEKSIRFVNLGFAPMSGMSEPQSFPERSMRFAYEKIRAFTHYRGLRDYKNKFEPAWYDKYLVYAHDYDLLQAPRILRQVIKY